VIIQNRRSSLVARRWPERYAHKSRENYALGYQSSLVTV